MRLTSRGWLTLLGGGVTIIAGLVVGMRELLVIGATAIFVALGAALALRTARVRLQVTREVRPARVPVDGSCRIELTLRNTAVRRSPVVVVSDPVGDGHHARLRLAPLAVGRRATLQYRLPVKRRGIVTVGPLEIEMADPFGLAEKRFATRSVIDVIVLPRIHDLDAVPSAPGDEPESGLHHHRTLATAQEEFSTLREFQPGDDVRKVHWPSTARLGRPIVRQFDEPWQRRTTVVLDVRSSCQDHESFERAVSAAASVISLCASRNEPVRLVTTGGHDSGFITNDHEVDATMDLLAGVQLSAAGSLTGTLRTLLIRRVGGTLVTCTGSLPGTDRSVLESAVTRFGTHLAVSCADHGVHPSPSLPGSAVVRFDDDRVLGEAWAQATRRLVTQLGRTVGTAG